MKNPHSAACTPPVRSIDVPYDFGMKNAPNAVLLASLPESEREAGSERGVAALRALEHYFSRVQAIWKPVSIQHSDV